MVALFTGQRPDSVSTVNMRRTCVARRTEHTEPDRSLPQGRFYINNAVSTFVRQQRSPNRMLTKAQVGYHSTVLLVYERATRRTSGDARRSHRLTKGTHVSITFLANARHTYCMRSCRRCTRRWGPRRRRYIAWGHSASHSRTHCRYRSPSTASRGSGTLWPATA